MNKHTAMAAAGAAAVPVGLAESVASSALSGYGGALSYASLGTGAAASVHLVGGLALLAVGGVMAARSFLGGSRGAGTYEAAAGYNQRVG